MTGSRLRYVFLIGLAVLYLGYAAVAGAVFITQDDARRMSPTQDPAGFELLWSGMYSVSDMRRVEDEKAPAGSRGIVGDYYAPSSNRSTTQIPARAGSNFGVAFRFRDASEETPVLYRAIWRFPRPGLTNPKNMKTFLEYETGGSACRGGVCVYGWSLSEPWEMVPGTWTLELWRGGTKLHEQAFEVVRP